MLRDWTVVKLVELVVIYVLKHVHKCARMVGKGSVAKFANLQGVVFRLASHEHLAVAGTAARLRAVNLNARCTCSFVRGTTSC